MQKYSEVDFVETRMNLLMVRCVMFTEGKKNYSKKYKYNKKKKYNMNGYYSINMIRNQKSATNKFILEYLYYLLHVDR